MRCLPFVILAVAEGSEALPKIFAFCFSAACFLSPRRMPSLSRW
jgi:hypothetical protein